jgi:glycosyltransferase involved in cell wall biosynthesis
MSAPRVWVITPMYNEEASFGAYVSAVEKVLIGRTDVLYNVLMIDDGSTDRTWELMQSQSRLSPRYRALRLSRNFGGHAAETAGLDHSDGDAVVTLSADLQDPPETVIDFVEAWRQGADVVWGHRRSRADSRVRVWTSDVFGRLLRHFALPRGSKFATGGFLLIDRKVVICLRQLREQSRLNFALVAWAGFQQEIVQYDRRERVTGKSGWSFIRMTKAMYDALVSFSGIIPRLITVLGLSFAAIGFFAAVYFLINALLFRPAEGWSSIMVALTFFFGITFLILGTIGEYLQRIYNEAARRPLYFVSADTSAPSPRPASPTQSVEGSADTEVTQLAARIGRE